jgi:hypothetical protein
VEKKILDNCTGDGVDVEVIAMCFASVPLENVVGAPLISSMHGLANIYFVELSGPKGLHEWK